MRLNLPRLGWDRLAGHHWRQALRFGVDQNDFLSIKQYSRSHVMIFRSHILNTDQSITYICPKRLAHHHGLFEAFHLLLQPNFDCVRNLSEACYNVKPKLR